MTQAPKPSIVEMLGAAEREIRYRERVYPRLISQGKMTPQKAQHEIRLMTAIRDTLAELDAKGRLL